MQVLWAVIKTTLPHCPTLLCSSVLLIVTVIAYFGK